MNYTVKLTEVENAALSYVVASQEDWIDNAVHERCRIAIDEIVAIALEKSIETNTPLPTSKDEIVLLAFEQGWVKSAVDQHSLLNRK
jgi:hypothetical protein